MPDEYAGRSVTCTTCKTPVPVPNVVAEPAPRPALRPLPKTTATADTREPWFYGFLQVYGVAVGIIGVIASIAIGGAAASQPQPLPGIILVVSVLIGAFCVAKRFGRHAPYEAVAQGG